jgi:uridine phosphorylase
MSAGPVLYHLGFGPDDLPPGTTTCLLSGDPGRSELIATRHLTGGRPLARQRGLDAFTAQLPGGAPVVCATSGMGAPSLSIVVNELVSLGITTVIRVGTSGSIQEHVRVGDVVISSAAVTDQGAARDIAPIAYPAVADPFLTVALARAAEAAGVTAHVGITASTDTFFEGQERTESSANPYLLRRLHGLIAEYRHLNVLNFEMEAGTLFTMGTVYGFRAGCVCAVVAQRTEGERPQVKAKGDAVDAAVRVAVAAADAESRGEQG